MYDHLSSLVKKGDIKIINIVSVPRSMSTVLEIAVAEMADAQINEVFNRGVSDINSSSNEILKIYENGNYEKPFTVVTKNLSNEIGVENFKKWSDISCLTVFTLREPITQTVSLIRRIGNDKLGTRGQSTLSFEDLVAKAAEVEKIFEKYNFERGGWEHLLQEYNYVRENKMNYLVIDGSYLSHFPLFHLKKISEAVGLDTTKLKVDTWSKFSRENFFNFNHYDKDYDENGISKNEWVKKANSSTSFNPDTNEIKGLDFMRTTFPLISNYILDKAYPTYVTLLKDKNMLFDSSNVLKELNYLSPVHVVEFLASQDVTRENLVKRFDQPLFSFLSKQAQL